MTQQKILRQIIKEVNPVSFLANRTWKMNIYQIEQALEKALERFPTPEEIKACKPDKIKETHGSNNKLPFERYFGKV